MHNSGRFAPSTEDLYAAAFEALPDPTVVVALQASGATIVAANELARRMPAPDRTAPCANCCSLAAAWSRRR